MSWRYYQVFTASPDFSTPGRSGLADERDTVDFSSAAPFTAWPGRTDRVFNFEFQTFRNEEWRLIRDFFDRRGGRAGAFYLPSWTFDFELAATAVAGSNEIIVEGNGLSESLVSERPDTVGRRIMAINHLGQISTHWVTVAVAKGGNDRWTLDSRIPNELEANRTMLCICYLSRLGDDTIQSQHPSPDHARASINFREVRHRSATNQTEPAEGPEIDNLNAVEDVIATDEDPEFPDQMVTHAIGPFGYAEPQTTNLQTDWIARLNRFTNQVTLIGPSYEGPTALYNAPAPANTIALTFDTVSKDILAWELDGIVTIARHGSPDPIRLSFPGLSPVAFNTYGIDSTVTAATATTAIFYLKDKDSTIYCRIAVENFATEYRWCRSPIAPLYLHAAIRRTGRMEIVGMDTTHRLIRWRSQGYLTPQEVQVVGSRFAATLIGEFAEVTVRASPEDKLGSRMGTTITGSFAELRIPVTVLDDGRPSTRMGTTITGAFSEIRIPVTATNENGPSSRLGETLTGAYTQVVIPKTATNENGPSSRLGTTITGTYS